jgi:hypothetical protein
MRRGVPGVKALRQIEHSSVALFADFEKDVESIVVILSCYTSEYEEKSK